jgi:AcrR family transcriptional regulator
MADGSQRREQVLATALEVFVRFGYRKTSMDDVAQAAEISRPGLYFLFSSKPELFRAAVVRALEADLSAAESALSTYEKPESQRLLEAFDHWTGRYLGPMTRDLPAVLEENPSRLSGLVDEYPGRFAALIEDALGNPDLAQTLISAALGIKHQVTTREEFRARLEVAIRVIAER